MLLDFWGSHCRCIWEVVRRTTFENHSRDNFIFFSSANGARNGVLTLPSLQTSNEPLCCFGSVLFKLQYYPRLPNGEEKWQPNRPLGEKQNFETGNMIASLHTRFTDFWSQTIYKNTHSKMWIINSEGRLYVSLFIVWYKMPLFLRAAALSPANKLCPIWTVSHIWVIWWKPLMGTSMGWK